MRTWMSFFPAKARWRLRNEISRVIRFHRSTWQCCSTCCRSSYCWMREIADHFFNWTRTDCLNYWFFLRIYFVFLLSYLISLQLWLLLILLRGTCKICLMWVLLWWSWRRHVIWFRVAMIDLWNWILELFCLHWRWVVILYSLLWIKDVWCVLLLGEGVFLW